MERLKVLAVGTSSDHMLRHIKYCDARKDNNILIDVFMTTINESVNVFKREGAGKVFGVKVPKIFNTLLRLPRISDYVRISHQINAYRKVLSGNKYSLVCIHQLHPYTLAFTKIAKKHGLKVMLCPWGSDVLRANAQHKKKLKKAFALADFVSSDLSFGFTDKYVNMYDVSRTKLVEGGYGSEVVSSIDNQKGRLSKNDIALEFNMPLDRYYITCGYAATRAQKHINMIEAVGANTSIFPRKPFLVFPFTYGPDKANGYLVELEQKCQQKGLDYCFVKDYMSIEKVARLRLLSDLYFHILPTDVCSSSLIEYILAGSICINGKWLDYPSLEKYQMPYYICNSLEELPEVIKRVFEKENPQIDIMEGTMHIILSGNGENRINKWYEFYYSFLSAQ